MHRNEFYLDGYHKVLSIALILCTCLIVSVVINFIFAFRKPIIQNFATTEGGRIIPIHPLDTAFVNSEIVKDFALKCALKTNSFTFGTEDHIKGEIAAMQSFFTPQGYSQFLKALKASGNVDLVKKEKLIISAGSSGAPLIVGEGTRNGIYGWKVEVPLMLTIYNYKGKRTTERLIKLFITRVPIVDEPRGIAVDQYLVANKTE